MLREHPQTLIVEEKRVDHDNQVSIRRYKKGNFLGKGGFGRVYELEDLGSGQIFAGKEISKSSLANIRTRQKLMNEIKIQKSLSHPNIVKLLHHFEDFENVYILLEFCSERTLNDMLHERERFSEGEVKPYLLKIISAVQYLHRNRVIHRDLKLSNVLLNDQLDLKLCDFGLACRLDFEGQRRLTVCGTPNYMAPEVISGKVGHSYEIDVWAIGVLLYTMLVGSPPFEAKEVKTVYKNIRYTNYSFPADIIVSDEAQSLIKQILVANPQRRLKLDEILAHPFLNKSEIPKNSPFAADKKSKFKLKYLTHVKHWVVSEIYGMGYLLSNGLLGAVFPDNSILVMDSVNRKYLYSSGDTITFPMSEPPNCLKSKIDLLQQFGCLLGLENVRICDKDLGVYVTQWNFVGGNTVFMLSNQNAHVLFTDGSEMIIEADLRNIDYIDANGNLYCVPQAKITDGDIFYKLRAASYLLKVGKLI